MKHEKADVMKMWKGIPAFYIASQMTLLGRGSCWQSCGKGMCADAICGLDKTHDYSDVDPQEIATKARLCMKSCNEATERTRRIEAKAAERRELLLLSREDIHNRLIELVRTPLGQAFVTTEKYQTLKEQARRICALDVDKAEVKKYVTQYLCLRDLIENRKTEGEGQ